MNISILTNAFKTNVLKTTILKNMNSAVGGAIPLRKLFAILSLMAIMLPVALPVPAIAAKEFTAEQQFAAKLFEKPESETTGGYLSDAASAVAQSFSASPLAMMSRFAGFGAGENEKTSVFDEMNKAENNKTGEANRANNLSKENESEAFSKESPESRVKDIEIGFNAKKTMSVGDTAQFSALPLDEKGAAVHGASPAWESSNALVLRIDERGRAVAIKPGTVELRATVGEVTETFNVEIVEANNIAEEDADDVAGENSAPAESPAKSAPAMTAAAAPALVLNSLPDTERTYLYRPENNLGNPPGQVEADSPNAAAATRVKHRAGIANFSFSVPFASLPGRGIDAGIGMIYNSRTWTKSVTETGALHFTYDVEQSWIAPGFTAGFGYVESQFFSYSTAQGMYGEVVPMHLTDVDGTRREIKCRTYSGSDCTSYETSDGSFIKIIRSGTRGPGVSESNAFDTTSFKIIYPDGTWTQYGAAGGSGSVRRNYPLWMQDSNGNRILIAYKDASGRIDYIQDTLNRYIRFYYDANLNLVAVTAPGFNGAGERQTIRFYYEDLALGYNGKFSGQVTGPPNGTIRALRYVYFPGTGNGFKYDYHADFGMITKITQLRGMTVNGGTVLTATGSVNPPSAANEAATTTYNYKPAGTTQLTDVPKYDQRTDDWAGRTSALAVTEYDAPEPQQGATTQSSKITVKNGLATEHITETISHRTSDWMNGMVKETTVTIPGSSTPLSKTEYFWKDRINFGRRNPVLEKIEITDELGQVRSIKYPIDQYDQFNNQQVVEEYDYKANGVDGSLLRKTVTSYETRQGWIDKNLIRLPVSVKVYSRVRENGADILKLSSRVEYVYDNNGVADLKPRTDMDDSSHDPYYNPNKPPQRVCVDPNQPIPFEGTIDESSRGTGQLCYWTRGYSPDSVYRGNVTKVTAFADPSNDADPLASVSTTKYDILGNPVEATVNCCQKKTWEYGDYLSVTGYAYPVEQTRGYNNELSSSVEYDKNTGLVTRSIDENDQQTIYQYNPSSLRLVQVDYPNGGQTITNYNDNLVYGADGQLLSYVETTTKLDASRTVTSRQYMNGRGQVVRSFGATIGGVYQGVQDVRYDALGRVEKSSNPYTAASFTSSINPSGKWTVPVYDAFGRTKEVALPDGNKVKTEFNHLVVTITYPDGRTVKGAATTTTDQTDKKRRQIVDSLGRVVRVDEPNSSGALDGGNADAPHQPTFYSYDGNDNLSEVVQKEAATGVTQTRKFVYDGLSRLIREKQPEANATLNDAGASGTSWSNVYKYNEFGNLVEGIDARGVKTVFSYEVNKLNRLKTVSYQGEVNYQTPSVTYTYGDEPGASGLTKGRLYKVQTAEVVSANQETPATAQIYDYDSIGQVKTQTQIVGGHSYVSKYDYNLAGQLVKQTYPSGKIVEFETDAAGRLSKVLDQQRIYASGFEYKPYGALGAVNLGNGTREENSFDETSGRLQLTGQKLLKGTKVLEQYNYSYGQVNPDTGTVNSKNNGQLAKVESYFEDTNGQNQKQWEQRFGYDELGRISEAREYLGSTTNLTYKNKFRYDRFGNQYRNQNEQVGTIGTNVVPVQITESTNATGDNGEIDKKTNRFTSQTGTVYDAAGNVSTDTKFRPFNYKYDANNRMVLAARNDGANIPAGQSVYDAAGQRVAQKIGDIWTVFVYDAEGKMIAEYGGTPKQETSSVSYLFTDWQGSTRTVTDAAGVVKGRYDYTAFGEEIGAGIGNRTAPQGYTETNVRNRYALTERDETTGLDHTWWRKNEGKAGRWTSPDPYQGSMSIGDPQSFNRYSYTNNDPVNFVDPNGLIREGPAPARSAAYWDALWLLLFGWGHNSIGTRDPGDNGGGGGGAQGQPTDKGFPCPPSWDEIAKKGGAEVFSALSKTWLDARNNNREEGGWIYMNKKGEVRAIRKERDERDRQTAINLTPPPIWDGWIVVANFHSHDNGAEPSQTVPGWVTGDVDINDKYGLPGLILGNTNNTKGDINGFTFLINLGPYGPERGFYGIGLPERCKKRTKKRK